MTVPLDSLLASLAIFIAVFSVFYVFVGNARLRRTEYDEKIHRIELDRTREAFERGLSRLHSQIYRDEGRWAELNHLLLDSTKRVENRAELIQPSIWGTGTSEFLINMGLNPVEIEIDQSLVFILTPFDKAHDAEYQIILDACEEAGLHATRGDEVKIDGPILPSIVLGILRAGLIIANINGRNPNVFYELGIAQALGKRTIMVAEVSETVPFDIAQQQLVLYNRLKDLRSALLGSLSRAANSSVISTFDYDSESRVLRVTFINGRTYRYRDVPKEVFEQLRRAPIKGDFFNSHIRDRYALERA